MLAVLQRQADGRIRIGIVRLDRLAVDLDGRRLCVDVGAVLTVHIVIRSDRFDRIGIDDSGAVARERLAVDRHAADDRVIEVIEVRAVDGAVVIKVDSAVFPAGLTERAARLIRQPEHALTRDDTQRVLLILILPTVLNICRAVHPTSPVNDLGNLPFGIFMRKRVVLRLVVIDTIFVRSPVINIRPDLIARRVFRCIDPDADLRGHALDLDPVATVANIEVGVTLLIERCKVIVQLHGIFAETHLTTFRCGRYPQFAAVIVHQRLVRPKVVGIAVGMEDVRSRNSAVPVARKAVGCGDFRRLRIIRVSATGKNRNW